MDILLPSFSCLGNTSDEYTVTGTPFCNALNST